ncbi:MAG: FecR domain-containing protein [Rhodocyclaceae bacterium]|nr:FecR domain-containing protein [Rhodocyclaceae bacterium]
MNLPSPVRASLLAALVAAAFAAPCALAGGDFVYTTREGDNLWDVALRLLKNPADWQVLQKANGVTEPRHMPVGLALRIPQRLLRFDASPAKVAAVRGDARRASGPLEAGTSLAAGEEVATGKDSFVALDLADGSRLVIQPESRLRLTTLQGSKAAGIYRTGLDLQSGRVENQVAKQKDTESGYRLRTPAAVIAVRGTGFRVAAESDQQARAEVTEGVVNVRGGKGKRVMAVHAGEGLLVASDARIAPAVALLPAPDLSGVPLLLDRVLMRFSFPDLPGAVAYRVQLAEDEAFRRVLAESVSRSPSAKFSGVPDGKLWLRVRGIADNGLEGRDAVRAVTLKARPEPPFASLPRPAGKVRGETVDFQWTNAEGASSYELQLSDGGNFSRPVQAADGLKATAWQSGKLAPGNYAWRVASVRADGDRGPYGDAVPFELRPTPAQPEPPAMDGDRMEFTWPAEPGQKFELELARDASFADSASNAVTRMKLAEPRVSLPRFDAGVWFMRVRATDPDGFVGPWTATQSFEVPASRPWWLLLILIPMVL